MRCEYCYIAQERSYRRRLFQIPYDLSFMRRAFSRKRFGGRCLINLCAGGETLLSMELLPAIRMFLEEGHYVAIVTNGTVSKAFDELSALPDALREGVFIKFSFHYLELKSRSLFEVFWSNVEKMRRSGISYTLEITPCDSLIPYIEEIQEMFRERAYGAMPHISVARNQQTNGIDILSAHTVEEYRKIWGVFDSPLFDFKMDIYHRKITEFCRAGEKSLSINLESGAIHSCVAHGYIGNLYDDVTEPVAYPPIGHRCRLPYCFNGHVYLTLGVCEDIPAPTYLAMRDRVDQNGRHWVNGRMAEVLSQKFF